MQVVLETRDHPFLPGERSVGTIEFTTGKWGERRNAKVFHASLVCREAMRRPGTTNDVGSERWRFDVEVNDGIGEFDVMIPDDVGLPGFRLAFPESEQLTMRLWYIEYDVVADGVESSFDRLPLPWRLWENQAVVPYPPESEITRSERRSQLVGRAIRVISGVLLLGGAVMIAWSTTAFVLFVVLPLVIIVWGAIDKGLRTRRQRLVALMTALSWGSTGRDLGAHQVAASSCMECRTHVSVLSKVDGRATPPHLVTRFVTRFVTQFVTQFVTRCHGSPAATHRHTTQRM